MKHGENAWARAVAATVRAELARRRMRALDLRSVLGLGRTAIYDRLNGEIPFDTEQLMLVARHLGMTVEEIVRDADARSRED